MRERERGGTERRGDVTREENEESEEEVLLLQKRQDSEWVGVSEGK